MTPTPEDLAYWREWIGKGSTRTDTLYRTVIQRYAAAIGEVWNGESPLPSMALSAFFLDAPQPGELGADGHPKRGGSMPPISLPRRMAGASETTFHRELTVDQPVTRKTAFSDITHKKGRSGDLVFVQTTTEIEQGGELCSTSKYTSIFRGEADLSAPSPQVEQPSPPEPRPGDEVWEPGPVDLFRYAAVTFNSHRIHYDLPYATGVEGYPGLLVQGPFTAAKLLGYARRTFGELSRFSFRAQSPMFAGQTIHITRGDSDGQVVARLADGRIGMSADFEVRS